MGKVLSIGCHRGAFLLIVNLLSAFGTLTHDRLDGMENLAGFFAWLMIISAIAYSTNLVWNRAEQIQDSDSQTITEMGIHCLKIYFEQFSLFFFTGFACFAVCLIVAGGGAGAALSVSMEAAPADAVGTLSELIDFRDGELLPRLVGFIFLPIAILAGFTVLFILYFVVDVIRAIYKLPMVAAILLGILVLGASALNRYPPF